MTIEEIRELIQLIKETSVAELEVQRGENRVRIRQSFGSETSIVIPAAVGAIQPAPAGPTSAPASQSEPSAPAGKAKESDLVYAKSPIVGTFYESPSPDAPAFVKVGDHVTPGKILCIIESMKLMNEIEADVAGVVESQLVQNAQPVEYGEALFAIRPV
jgi:acetyl-CoA carboxylase biotin carboxyl carrier protein